MHEKLAQKYVEKARKYEQGDLVGYPGSPEDLTFALVSVAGERDDAVAKLRAVVKAYEKSTLNMRTADFHAVGCSCLRCAIDNARPAE